MPDYVAQEPRNVELAAECARAMIRHHGRRAREIAQRLADTAFVMREHDIGAFWAEVAQCLLCQRNEKRVVPV